VGVAHSPEKMEEVLQQFPVKVKGKSVGLEVDQFVMAEFERIKALQARKKISFEDAFLNYYLTFLGLIKEKAGQPKAQVKKDLSKLKDLFLKHPEKMAKDFSQYKFYFNLFERLSARGFKVKSLERRTVIVQTLLAQLKTKSKAREKMKLFILLRGPVRNRWLVEKAPRADYWVLGAHHLEDVEKGLKEKGLNPKIIFSEPLDLKAPIKGLERVYVARYFTRRKKRSQTKHKKPR
jgi:hypothetical protein